MKISKESFNRYGRKSSVQGLDQISANVWIQIRAQVRGQILDQIINQIWDQVFGQVLEKTCKK